MKIFAIGSHPDDIEFMMGGTLILLKERGCTIHYMNIANGSCGTQSYNKEEIIKIRREEGKKAANFLSAFYHESLTDDLDVFYKQSLIRKVAAIIRKLKPDILLTLSLEDYMEDHINTSRIVVTSAFVKGMLNYETDPPVPPIQKDIALYHALPYGLKDMMRHTIYPEFYVDVGSVLKQKKCFLSFHKSQKEWLDKSQGYDSYLKNMEEMTQEVGKMSGKYKYAEGWRRHNHIGYSSKDINPLWDLLDDLCIKDKNLIIE